MKAQVQKLLSAKKDEVDSSQFSSAPARPFLKWVGGKAQLLKELDSNIPQELKDGKITTYVEPFVGGGALFFHLAQKYPVKKFFIADNNRDLILAYRTIRDRVGQLITVLHDLENKYKKLSQDKREKFYYTTRNRFNINRHELKEFSPDWIARTAQLIFLNKTCFNGLYRLNAAGHFNASFGQYADPTICDPDNLVEVSYLLRKAEIRLCDFENLIDVIDSDSFIYIDPPYRPLNETSNFTGYLANNFTDDDQKRVASFCRCIDKLGARFLLSNSDPSNEDPADKYFEKMYPRCRIVRTSANRMINCRADRRGKINELLIMNY